jgi:tetratricopeptide (TPR) repeat protein
MWRLAVALFLGFAAPAPAGTGDPGPSVRRGHVDASRRTAEARRLFRSGAALVREARWADALTAFERSLALRPHAVTIYNIAACERALGRYARAATLYLHALSMTAADGGGLNDALRSEAGARVAEMLGLLVS